MTPDTPNWDPPETEFRRNFERLVLGSIDADFCKSDLLDLTSSMIFSMQTYRETYREVRKMVKTVI